jgi:nucleoside-diphosphate-sugar epimerase
MKPKTIAITGLSGYFGKVLFPLLDEDPDIERIIGIDKAPLPELMRSEKVEFKQTDIRDPKLETLVEGADALVHMAFVLMRRPGMEDLDEVNIGGTQQVIRMAGKLGIPKLIVTSSVVGYGLHPDNPIPLTEESPLRPNESLYYSREKAANEAFLDQFVDEQRDMIVTRLRPCTVVGPNADPDQMTQMVAKTVPVVRGHDPPYQLLHEEDLAQAIYLSICDDLPGIYNVTSDEPRSLRQLVQSRGGKVIALPAFILRAMLGILWLGGASVFAPEWIDLSRYSIVASNDKLKSTGWKPAYTTPEAFLAVLAAFGDE